MVRKTSYLIGFLFLLAFPSVILADDDLVADVLLRPEEKKEKKEVAETALDQLFNDVKDSEVAFVPPDDPSLEYPEDDKFYEPEPIDDYKFELLLDSILTNTELDIPDPVNINEGEPWIDWGKDSFFIDGDLDKMIVRFQYKDNANRPQEKPEGFYLKISFTEDRSLGEQMGALTSVNPQSKFNQRNTVTIQHSMPKVESERGGFLVKTTGVKQQRVFLRGRDDTSIIIIIPKIVQRDTRAVVLCPRDYDPWKLRGGSKKMHHTGYEMVAIESTVRGKAEAGVLSGHGAGIAKAHILTSKDILPAKNFFDKSILQYPSVSLEYVPFGKKSIQPQNNEAINSGILIQTVHHNSFNQKTISTGEVKMSAREFNMEEEIPVKVDFLKKGNGDSAINFKMEAGSCYAIMKKRSLKHKFVKALLPEVAKGGNK